MNKYLFDYNLIIVDEKAMLESDLSDVLLVEIPNIVFMGDLNE